MRFLTIMVIVAALGMAAVPAWATNSIVIAHPWARATPGGAQTGAVYMTLINNGDSEDRLTGGESSVAEKVQVHEMKVENGVMHMREVSRGLTVPAKGKVTLEPGTYHMMLIGLKQPLKKGTHIALTLTFARSGKIDVTVPVLAMGAMHPGVSGSGMHHMDMH